MVKLMPSEVKKRAAPVVYALYDSSRILAATMHETVSA